MNVNLKGINKSSVIGVIVLALALTNAILQMFGLKILPISNDDVNTVVSGLWVVLSSAYSTYKNFNTSTASQTAQQITDAIKNGEILEEDIDAIIENAKRK